MRIATASLAVRSGPDAAYSEIGTVHEGQVYVVGQGSGTYLEIWYNRNQGWIHTDQVAPKSTLYDIVLFGTNVRTGPSTSYPKIGYAKTGSAWAVFEVSSSGSWHRIFYEGQLAWYYAADRATTHEYVAEEGPASFVELAAVRTEQASVAVRSGPGVGFDVVGTLPEGHAYVSSELYEGWRKIWLSRVEGWVSDGEVAPHSAEYDTVDWDWLNVRTGPGLEYTKVSSVPAGSQWVTLEYSGSWHRVYMNGDTYWISGVGVTARDYVAPDGEAPSPTVSTVGFVKLPASGPGFVRRCGANNPDHAWGTPGVIHGLIAAAEDWAWSRPDAPRVRIGDISLPDGGVFDDNGSLHRTHQQGTDIDIFLLRLDGSDEGAPDIYDAAYSSSLTRSWIEGSLAVALPEVTTHGILLCDPALFSGLTTLSADAVCPGEGCPMTPQGAHVPPGPGGLPYVLCNPGHHDHMHVRTAEP